MPYVLTDNLDYAGTTWTKIGTFLTTVVFGLPMYDRKYFIFEKTVSCLAVAEKI